MNWGDAPPFSTFHRTFLCPEQTGLQALCGHLENGLESSLDIAVPWLRTAFNRPLSTPALEFDDAPAVDELTVSRLRMFKVATQLSCSMHVVSRNGTETRHRDHTSWWNMNFSGHCITAYNCMAFCRSTLCIFDRKYQQIVNTKLGWHLLQHTIDTMSWARYWKVRLCSFDGYQCGKVNNTYTVFDSISEKWASL